MKKLKVEKMSLNEACKHWKCSPLIVKSFIESSEKGFKKYWFNTKNLELIEKRNVKH